jgi:hypothetical protein
MVTASYAVWRQERLRYLGQRQSYEAELAKNTRPEIKGKLYGVVARGQGNRTSGGIDSCNTQIVFHIEACNQRPVETNLWDLRFDGAAMRPPATFAMTSICEGGKGWTPIDLTSSVEQKTHPVLPFGLRVDLVGSASVEISGHDWPSLGRKFSLAGLKVELIDGFGGAHLIQIEPNAEISVN